MKTIKKCIQWYIKALGEAYKGESYSYFRLY